MTDAVPRLYAGTAFRSSLEADWACTLDALGVHRLYEPATFQLPSGDVYVPDFHLPDIGTWIEVKGPETPRIGKAREFAAERACACSDICGCRWPGGEIVLIGRPSLRRLGMRFGALAWEDPLSINTALAKCRHCGAYSWCRLREALACRQCRQPHERGHLAASGELPFRRSEQDGLSTALNTPSTAGQQRQIRQLQHVLSDLARMTVVDD